MIMRKREKNAVVIKGLKLLFLVSILLIDRPIFYYTHIMANFIVNYIVILVIIAVIGFIIDDKPKE